MGGQGGEDDCSSAHVNLKGCDLNIIAGRRRQRAANWRVVRVPVISVAVIDEILFTRECISMSLQALGHDFEVVSFSSCQDCLESTSTHDLVLYHAHADIADNEDGERLASFDRLKKIAPLVVLCTFTSPEVIFDAFEAGVTGYIPAATTSIKLAIEIIRLVRAGGTFVPQSALLSLEPDRRGANTPSITVHGLTPRQMEVLDRLRLGKANKIIAYELGVSESTIKVEIHNIMKKMSATNRTEVACRATALAPSHRA
jgi:DNA-binding NarL/FixJ family response regulator